jgi:large conductance mechanosensitive channel
MILKRSYLSTKKKKQEAAPAPVPEPSKEELLLTEIRDLLREQKK